MWDVFFNLSSLKAVGFDAVTYFFLAIIGTLLFLIRLGFAFFGGGDSDFDLDASVDSDVSFGFFSVLSILAFFMGAGWMGLSCRLEWGMGRLPSSLIASGFGLSMMMFASGLTYLSRRLNRSVEYDLATAVGKIGRAYMKIPAQGQGRGQVEVSVSGRKMILKAVTQNQEIAAFADVKITEVRDDKTLVVEPLT